MNVKYRLCKIDELRGLTLISMILYHFCWDLRFIAGFKMDWYTSLTGKVWQKSICMTFILISGFCFSMGRKRFKRSMTIFLCGLIITAVTLIFLPQNRIIFGVLTFIGTAGLLTIPVDRMLGRGDVDYKLRGNSRVDAADRDDRDSRDNRDSDKELCKSYRNLRDILCLVCFFALFLACLNINKHYLFFGKVELPEALCQGYINTFLGFTDRTFFSTDYFSLLPWYFLYLCGYFLYKIYTSSISTSFPKVTEFLAKPVCKPLSFIGKHSLIIYMLHQPVLYAITLLLI